MNKSDAKKSSEVAELIKKALKPLEAEDKVVFETFKSMADDGFFEGHQTAGAFRRVAREILASLPGKDNKQ